jgi:hypothetical protein
MSKGQSAISVRHIINAYESIYQKIQNNITILGAKKSNSKSIVVLSIPSENNTNKFYIVALEIDSIDRLSLDTKMRVYSNSPSFLFNFSYVFHQKGALLYPNKYPSVFLTTAPKMRNPYETLGFEKNIFSAIRYISDYKLSRILAEFNGKSFPDIPKIAMKTNERSGKLELI